MALCKEFLLSAVNFALMSELNTTPKPGLVDRRNSGAHSDMDYSLMLRSVNAATQGIGELLDFAEAWVKSDENYSALACGLKRTGALVESRMKESFGVNTHNGALFSLGLTAVSVLLKGRDKKAVAWLVVRLAGEYEASTQTKGAKAASRYGLKGALTNAKEGYPEVFDLFMPYFALKKKKYPFNEACVLTLMYIATVLDDTNLYVRGGLEGAIWAQTRLKELLSRIETQGYDENEIIRVDDEFSQKKLSPGGSADMLALTIFLDIVFNENNPYSGFYTVKK